MTYNERLLQAIENLNESGLELVLSAVEIFSQNEKYNRNTSRERLEELQKIHTEEERHSEEEKNRLLFERAQAECERQREFKASLVGREKHFFDVLEYVHIPDRYDMKYWEMMLLTDTYNNSLLDGLHYILNYGFMKGQRAEKNRAKKVRKC